MPTYTPLQSIELTEATATVTFSNISQVYQDLVLIIRSGSSGNDGRDIYLQFNGDTGSNYSRTQIVGNGTTASSSRSSNNTEIRISPGVYSNTPLSNNVIAINNYSNTTTNKTVLSRNNGTGDGVGATVGLWRNTSAITSITLYIQPTANIVTGSTFDLYGISPVAANNAQAFGGTDIYYDSTYVYHVFKGSGTFTPYRNLTADVLVIAGGGGGGTVSGVGGSNRGGGGGAGGLLAHTSQSLTANTGYTVTVGAGGSRGVYPNPVSTNGSTSQFGSLTASVGGGTPNVSATASSGGSGGGGNEGYNGGAGTAGQGNAGANGGAFNSLQGGGGGGAGAAGSSTSGGNGVNTYSSWATATGTGANSGYYAGGGGGGPSGSAGLGGGGAGGGATDGVAGTTNTGGGGGGCGSTGNGGSGGSGIVIVRYAR